MVYSIMGGDFAAAGEAATRIKRALAQLGLPSSIVRRVAIAAYEAEMNIVIHATRGQLKVDVSSDRIEVTARDEGPGIPDIELAMQEGYSTAPEYIREMGFGAGMGLPNMRRYSDEFYIQSQVGQGTTVQCIIYTGQRADPRDLATDG